MKTTRGFTLIEVMIVLAIIGIIAAFSVQFFQDTRSGDGTVCKGGYKFVRAYGGKYSGAAYTQVLDNQGHGIPCSN